MMFNYSDIPDDTRAKPFFPLMPVVWQFYRENGWDMSKKFIDECEDCAYYFFEDRLNESIKTSKMVFNNEIAQPDKVLSYVTVIPPLPIRSDLTQGSHKLLGGESFDVLWMAIDDLTQEVFVFLNAHCEDGIPVDWWMVKRGDELLDRRHMKLGWKLREMPRRIKDLTQTAAKTMDILKDIRYERTPEWGNSDYIVAPVWTSFAVDMFLEGSNYETIANSWEGWAAKEVHHLPDYLFALNPWPVIFRAFFMGGRSSFTSKVAHLTAEGHLYCQPIEERTYERFNKVIPEGIEMLKTKHMLRGIPTPSQTLDATMPNMKKKSDPDNRFNLKYPNDAFIKPDELGLEWDDLRRGVYFDITPDTEPNEKLDESKILSKGIGTKTIFS